jgi:hypothetical protein
MDKPVGPGRSLANDGAAIHAIEVHVVFEGPEVNPSSLSWEQFLRTARWQGQPPSFGA